MSSSDGTGCSIPSDVALSDDEQFLRVLFTVAEKKKWRKLNRMLQKPKYQYLCLKRDSTGLSLLSIAVVSDVPSHIIDAILKVDPTQAYLPDAYGATPLHVACLNGSSPKTVQKLITMKNDLIYARDRDDRVPLHHAVECICRRDIPFNEGKEVIRLLCEVDSSTVHSTDKNSYSPLDIVQIARTLEIAGETDGYLERVYEMLALISKHEYLRKKRIWEGQEVNGNSTTTSTITSAQSLSK